MSLTEPHTASLSTVLQHALETLHEPPTEERAAATFNSLFNEINIPLINQVNLLIPTSCLIKVFLPYYNKPVYPVELVCVYS